MFELAKNKNHLFYAYSSLEFYNTILTSHKNITACHTCCATSNIILSWNKQQQYVTSVTVYVLVLGYRTLTTLYRVRMQNDMY